MPRSTSNLTREEALNETQDADIATNLASINQHTADIGTMAKFGVPIWKNLGESDSGAILYNDDNYTVSLSSRKGAIWAQDFGFGYKHIHLRGMIKKSTNLAPGDLLFTLAAGYRPSSTMIFPVVGQYTGFAVLRLYDNGEVVMMDDKGFSSTDNNFQLSGTGQADPYIDRWIELSGISFWTSEYHDDA